MTLHRLRAAAEQAGAALTEAAAAIGTADPGAHALNIGGPGRLGELADALHRQLVNAIAARSREAAAHGARFSEVAQLLARVDTGYAEVEHAVRRRGRIGGA